MSMADYTDPTDFEVPPYHGEPEPELVLLCSSDSGLDGATIEVAGDELVIHLDHRRGLAVFERDPGHHEVGGLPIFNHVRTETPR